MLVGAPDPDTLIGSVNESSVKFPPVTVNLPAERNVVVEPNSRCANAAARLSVGLKVSPASKLSNTTAAQAGGAAARIDASTNQAMGFTKRSATSCLLFWVEARERRPPALLRSVTPITKERGVG